MGNSPITARINALLAEKGIPKNKFYNDCDITSASFSLWNTGKTYPKEKNLQVIAKYLNTTAEYLRTGLGERSPSPLSIDLGDGETKTAPDDGSGMSHKHQELLKLFDACGEKQRTAILEMAKLLAEQKGE